MFDSSIASPVGARGEENDEPEAWETAELADALVAIARQAAVAECRWLGLLAVFDRREGWRADGQLSGVDWLVWRCGLARRTAREKLRVAHELRRRPLVQAAFARGDLSYAKVRAITRVEWADEETDKWILRVAERGTAATLERLAWYYRGLREQERGVDDYLARFDRRALRASRTYDGMMVVEVVLPVEEGEALLADLETARRRPVGTPVDSGPAEPSGRGARSRVDALLDLVRAGRAGLDRVADPPDRTTVHVVTDLAGLAERVPGGASLLDGAPLTVDTLRRLACDSGVVRHVLAGASQPLDVGTRTRVWTAAQRRSVALRDGGTCRFPGCWRRTCDVHHLVHWADGGATSVENGFLQCRRHHTLLHEGGFRVTGHPGHRLTFHRPDGTPLGPSEPPPGAPALRLVGAPSRR